MVRFIGTILAALLLVGLFSAACGPSTTSTPIPTPVSKEKAPTQTGKAPWESELEKLVAEAKKEGKLMIYSTPSGEVVREVSRVFQEKFGVEVEFVSGRGEELARRLEAEKAAGLYVADVIMTGGGTLQTVMKPRGLVGKLEPLLFLPEVTDPNAWVAGSVPFIDEDRTGIAMVAGYLRHVMRNTDLVKEGEVTSYRDLLDPKWKGKMVLNDPSVTGTGNAFLTMLAANVWGIEGTKEFMRELVKQEPVITRDRRMQGEWVARGKYPLSIATHMDTASEFIRAGAPVAYVKKIKEGGEITTGAAGLAVPIKSPHPNGAKLFINWILGREGHATFIKYYGNPGARRDAPREGIPQELFADPDEKVYLQREESILLGSEMVKIAKEIFAPLLK